MRLRCTGVVISVGSFFGLPPLRDPRLSQPKRPLCCLTPTSTSQPSKGPLEGAVGRDSHLQKILSGGNGCCGSPEWPCGDGDARGLEGREGA